MKITRDLSVFCERESVDLVISRIEELMGGDWHRSRQGEARMRPVALGEAVFAFVQRSKGERPAVALVMTYDRGALRVINIVPRQGELSTDEYNAILTEFHLRFLHPAASGLTLRTELSHDVCGGGVRLEGDEAFEGLFASREQIRSASPRRKSMVPIS